MITIEREFQIEDYANKGREFAEECIAQGADVMIKAIKEEISK